MSCALRPQNTAENSQSSPGCFMKSISCGDGPARARAGQVLCFVEPLFLESTVFKNSRMCWQRAFVHVRQVVS